MVNLERDNSDNRTPREKILDTASTLITGQRQDDYGSPQENFQHIADSWTLHLRKILKEDTKISARQVAEMMMLLKIARTIKSPTDDSYVDAAGYAGIAGELAAEEKHIREMIQVKKVTDESIEVIAQKVVKDKHNCGPWCK